MDCRKVRQYLAMYLDSELGPETTFEISSHLEECSDCHRVAEQEQQLEKRLRGALRNPQSEDDALWVRSIARLKQSQSRRRFPVNQMTLAGLAIAATIAAFLIVGRSWTHDELDLAEATAADHTNILSDKGLGSDQVRDPARIDEYFRTEISPAYCLEIDTSEGLRFIGGNICAVSNARAAHLVCASSQTTISLFWFPSEAMVAFPETISRFREHGSSFHCHVDPYEFFVNRTTGGFVVGIGELPPAELESIVVAASSAVCGSS